MEKEEEEEEQVEIVVDQKGEAERAHQEKNQNLIQRQSILEE